MPAPDLRHYDAVLIDLDGTFYREEKHAATVLPGAVELVQALRRRGQPFACLTNSGGSPGQLSRRLTSMGADIEPELIWSCSAAAADYVVGRFGKDRPPRVFNLAADGTTELLDGRVIWVETPDEPCDAVMVAAPINPLASPARQWIALQLVRRGAALVGQCADRVYPSDRGAEFGAGALTEMLAYAANVNPVYCGKPEALFYEQLCARIGAAPDRCVLIGDNLDSDVAGARGVHMQSILVLSGVSTAAEAHARPPHLRPEHIINSLTELG